MMSTKLLDSNQTSGTPESFFGSFSNIELIKRGNNVLTKPETEPDFAFSTSHHKEKFKQHDKCHVHFDPRSKRSVTPTKVVKYVSVFLALCYNPQFPDILNENKHHLQIKMPKATKTAQPQLHCSLRNLHPIASKYGNSFDQLECQYKYNIMFTYVYQV